MKLILIFLLISTKQIHSLTIEEVQEQITNLNQTLFGTILVASLTLDNRNTDLRVFGQNTLTSAIISIEGEEEFVKHEIQEIKDLANAAAVDISVCLQGREDYLNGLSATVISGITGCINGNIETGTRTASTYKYLIGLTLDRVEGLQKQLEVCSPENEDCLNVVSEEVAIYEIDLPNKVEIELEKAIDLYVNFEVLINTCASSQTTLYVSSAGSVVDAIMVCANTIINQLQ